MNPTMMILHEVRLPNGVKVQQIKETYENGAVGCRIIKTNGFKVVSVGALFTELKSDRLFAQATNIRGAVQEF